MLLYHAGVHIACCISLDTAQGVSKGGREGGVLLILPVLQFTPSA